MLRFQDACEGVAITLKSQAEHILIATRKLFTVLSREITQLDLVLKRCLWHGWIEGCSNHTKRPVKSLLHPKMMRALNSKLCTVDRKVGHIRQIFKEIIAD